MSAPVTGVLLAAGASKRMLGDHKLLKEIDGEPLLRRSAKVLLNASLDHVRVVVPSGSQAHINALKGLHVTIIECPDAALGMSASLRVGFKDIPTDGALIALADMPELTAEHIQKLGAKFTNSNQIIQPVDPTGKSGHPVIFGAQFYDELQKLTGDTGARTIIQNAQSAVTQVPMDFAVTCDLDTPDDWTRWSEIRPDTHAT